MRKSLMSSITALALASISGGATVVPANASLTLDNNKGSFKRISTSSKTDVKVQKRAERSYHRYPKSYWLMPVNKESFKQARRKQLKQRAFKKQKRKNK